MFDRLKKKIARKFNKSDNIEKKTFSPLDLRLNSQVTINTNVPIIYDSLCSIYSDKRYVTAIGVFSIADSKVFRFYFDYTSSFLQIIIKQDTHKIVECRLFTLYHVIEPTSNKGWSEWLDDEEGKIGLFNFETAERNFIRSEAWADPKDDRVNPFSVRENILSIAYDDGKYTHQEETKTDHEMMLYGRWLNEDNDIAEYVLLSSDDEQLNTDKEVSNIKIYIGLDINISEINVI